MNLGKTGLLICSSPRSHDDQSIDLGSVSKPSGIIAREPRTLDSCQQHGTEGNDMRVMSLLRPEFADDEIVKVVIDNDMDDKYKEKNNNDEGESTKCDDDEALWDEYYNKRCQIGG